MYVYMRIEEGVIKGNKQRGWEPNMKDRRNVGRINEFDGRTVLESEYESACLCPFH